MAAENPANAVLASIRVLEFASFIAGPYCGMLLGDLGANVLKVERPKGDDSRTWGTAGREGDWSALFAAANRNKLSVTLDLKDGDDLAVAHKLCAEADVIIESFVPGSAAALGLDFKSNLVRNPDVIHCSVTAYGNQNQRSELGGYDGIVQAYSGIMALNGLEGWPPVRMPISAIDYFAGSLAFGSVLTAIMARGAGAGGQLVDVSLFDAAVNFLSPFLSGAASDNYRVQRAGADNPMAYPFSVFETSNGHVSLGVGNDGAWRRFCDALDIPDVCERYPRMEDRLAARETLDPIMKDTLRRFTSEEVTKRLELARVPATAVRTPGDLVRDPFSEERGAVEWLTAKDADSRVVVAASPIRLSKTPGRMWRLPPSIGENNDDYRSAWLSAVPDESSQD